MKEGGRNEHFADFHRSCCSTIPAAWGQRVCTPGEPRASGATGSDPSRWDHRRRRHCEDYAGRPGKAYAWEARVHRQSAPPCGQTHPGGHAAQWQGRRVAAQSARDPSGLVAGRTKSRGRSKRNVPEFIFKLKFAPILIFYLHWWGGWVGQKQWGCF